MSNAGQAILSIGGAALGFVFGGPAGAAWGFQLGGLAGSALFPTDLGTVHGPRLNDLNVQSSAVGAPIPLVYGTYAIAGNVIWSSGIIETVSRKKQGGKGGPTQTVTTYTYKVNCAVGVCEGEIGGIVRIWADAKLIYDAREQLDGETDEDFATRTEAAAEFLNTCEIYLGDEAQAADPTIESFEGAGNVSGFRGLAYVVFSEFQLVDYGNRVPNFRFEVQQSPVQCSTVTEYSNEVIYDWLSGAIADPRNPNNAHQYKGADNLWHSTYASALQTIEDYFNNHVANISPITAPASFPFWSKISTGHTYANVAPYNALSPGDQYKLFLQHFWIEPDSVENTDGTGAVCDITANQVVLRLGTSPGVGTDIFWRLTGSTDCTTTPLHAYFSSSGYYLCDGGGVACGYAYNYGMGVARVPTAPVADEDGAWTYTAGSFRVLQAYSSPGEDYDVDEYPLSPALPAGHVSDTQEYWETAYAAAVAAGDMAGGLTYGVDYPVSQAYAYTRSVEQCVSDPAGRVTLAAIVSDLCGRVGLTAEQIDVSDLTELVHGYAIGTVMTARDAINPLRSYGFFDCVESDGVLKWPVRGKAAVATIVADDLASHEASGARPPAVETVRTQTVDLPRRLRVHYAQAAMNYEPGEQAASRLSSGAEEVRDVELAVAMGDTKAAQIADAVLYDLWVSRNTHRIILDQSHLALEPGDAITMPLDGRQERVRIVSMDYAIPGLMRIECVGDDDGVYQSYAVGASAAYAGTGGGTIATRGTPEMVLLDLPLLRDSDNDAGYYAAIHSVGGTIWSGAGVYRSPDGGATYELVATTTEEATVGSLVSALPDGPTSIVDEGNELVVELDSGELESISEVSLLAGLNAAAIGADGRWEVIQFRDATLAGSPPTWTLTGLLRGRRGTEWAVGMSQAGDKFVLLDSALMRVPMNLSALGAPREHKGVLSGTTLDSVTAVSFAGDGVALEPFSVVDVTGDRSSGDLVISWIRRGRIGTELAGSGVDIPLSEETEAYEIDVLDGGSPETVLRTLTSSTQSVTYTDAQQTADFGSPVPESVTVRIYQMSAAAGRGYPSEATI